jgi:hypothetical protein
VREGKTHTDLFKIIDDKVWDRLKPSMKLVVKDGRKGAFDPIYFHVESSDDYVSDSYLYNRGATYDWEINYRPKPKQGWISRLLRREPKQSAKGSPLTPKTDRPSVVQFIPMMATICDLVVTIRYDKQTEPVRKTLSPLIDVGKPTIFGIVAAFQTVELVAFAIALIVAIVTGMQSQVYQNALSGSLSAYFALFAWGFAADQIKNLLEHIRTLMGPQE